jgi:hypothetical protein
MHFPSPLRCSRGFGVVLGVLFWVFLLGLDGLLFWLGFCI